LALPKISSSMKVDEKHELELIRIIAKEGKKFFTIKRKKGQWLEGQLEFPTFILETSDRKLNQYPKLSKKYFNLKSLICIKSNITKYKIKNHIAEISLKEFKKIFPNEKFSLLKLDVEKSNFSSTTLKIIKKMNLAT